MMPPKSRTKRSKATPPPPTTSTVHATTRHRHSYSGPSTVSPSIKHARKTNTTDDDEHATGTDAKHEQKEKEKKLLAEVATPGPRSSFRKFIYTLAFVAFLLLAWWVYGMVVLLQQMKEDVGWWGIIVGDTSERARGWGRTSEGSGVWFGDRGGRYEGEGEGVKNTVEGSLNALADALGVPAVQIAHAVKPLVPSESLASIAARAEETGQAMKILFEDTTQREKRKEWKGFTEEDVMEESVD